MIRINIKPFSVNDAWKGQRYKTDEYKQYEQDLMFILPPQKIILEPKKKYQIHFKFGFSSGASDWDNCIKTTQDCIAKRYGFNDKLIKRGIVDTEKVKKSNEFFEFEIIEIK